MSTKTKNKKLALPKGYRLLKIGELIPLKCMVYVYGTGPWTLQESPAFSGKELGKYMAPHAVQIKHPALKPAASNEEKIARALRMVAESRPSMSKLNRVERQKLEASARATIAGDKWPAWKKLKDRVDDLPSSSFLAKKPAAKGRKAVKAAGYDITVNVTGAVASRSAAMTAILCAFASRKPDGCAFNVRRCLIAKRRN